MHSECVLSTHDVYFSLLIQMSKCEYENYAILMYSTSNDGPKVMCSSLFQDTRHWKHDARPSTRPMHQNSIVVDCCCLEIRGEGVWVVDLGLQTCPILVVFGQNSGIKSCVGNGNWGQIAPTIHRSVGIGHMQMDLGSISGRIEQGGAESLRSAQNHRQVVRWNFRWCACFSRPRWWAPCRWT